METIVGAAGHISSEEFEPFCKWQRDSHDTLIVHLPEFKKEQLKVYITNRGILKVSGERSTNFQKKSKFYKEFVVPGTGNTNGIQANLANGQLFILMPKNTNVVVPVSRGKQLGKMAVNVGLGVAVLVGLMAFVVYMYKSTLLED